MRKPIIIISLTLVLVLAGLGAAAYGIFNAPESFMTSRVTVEGVNVEDDSWQDLSEKLYAQKEDFRAAKVTWSTPNGEKELTVEELGYMPLFEELEDPLVALESLDFLGRTKLILFGQELSYPAYLDEAAFELSFQGQGVEQGMKEASYFTVEDGTVQIDPEQIGYGLNAEETEVILAEMWASHLKHSNEEGHDDMTPFMAELPLNQSDPTYTVANLEPYISEAQAYTEKSITLEDAEFANTWILDFSDKISWMLPSLDSPVLLSEEVADELGEESTELSDETEEEITEEVLYLSLSPEAVAAYAEEMLIPEINQESNPATITEHEDGSITFEGSARFGRELALEAFIEQLENYVNTETQVLLKLPINQIEPEITVSDSLAERGITDLLDYGSTSFYGSTNTRIHNVNTGVDLFDQQIIEQGGTFSFTTLMGPIDAAHGWLPELVILGDETKKEYGGGLCQVSSTMYRAALFLGLPVNSRRNHSYAVGYYASSASDDDRPTGQGLDATIYEPWPDLQFINDTPGDILIQGYTDGYDAYFVFYGTNDGRTVELDGPYAYDYWTIPGERTIYTDELAAGQRQVMEYSTTGFKVDWIQTITYPEGHHLYPEGHVEELTIHSNYEARQLTYKEGYPVEEESIEGTEDTVAETDEALE